MSDSAVYNLLAPDAVKDYRLVPGYAWPGRAEQNNWTQRAACTPGKTYTLSTVTNVAGEVCFGFYLADGSCVRPNGYEAFPAGESVVRTLTAPEGAEYVAASWADGNRLPMVVEGDTPAAAGEGALMSANLLAEGDRRDVADGTTYADGVWSIPANGTSNRKNAVYDWPTGTEAVTENQTLHVGLSIRAASGASVSVAPGVAYVDGAGNVNYVSTTVSARGTGAWQRVEGSFVMPSGMRVSFFFVRQGARGAAALELTAPCLSYGSPVRLASSAHTPYATQDHVSVTYATKASLKVTDDSVKAEVTARTKTDQMVSEVSSRLTQTADGFSASIDRLSDTDKKVNSWFGFGADASGNPQLTMGSSSSPVVGVYTNTGLAYQSRSGATLLELDGASRSSTMPHVHADDVSMGSWQWMPTQGGTHLTLMWIGG